MSRADGPSLETLRHGLTLRKTSMGGWMDLCADTVKWLRHVQALEAKLSLRNKLDSQLAHPQQQAHTSCTSGPRQ
jgi:hypothetical protein